MLAFWGFPSPADGRGHFGKKPGLAVVQGYEKRIGVSLPNSVSASKWTMRANTGKTKRRHACRSTLAVYTAQSTLLIPRILAS